MQVDAEPWDVDSRRRSVAGWTFPVGQAQIRDALLRAETRARHLSLGGGYDGGPHGLVRSPALGDLVRCWWSSNTNPSRRRVRTDDGASSGWTGLDVHAVLRTQAHTARELLTDYLLDQAVGWISAIGVRGEGWRASDHELVLKLDERSVRRMET